MEEVLVVDDSKFSRRVSKEILEKLNHKILGEAVDGVDGIAKFQELSPSLIVTDIEMPNLDGIGMIQKIRDLDSDVKIVVVTSVVNSQVIQEVKRLKISVVKKPINETKLQNAITLLSR